MNGGRLLALACHGIMGLVVLMMLMLWAYPAFWELTGK